MSSRSRIPSASSAALSPPLRFAWPISLASALRRACLSCSACWLARRVASIASACCVTPAKPRRAIAASNASGASRIRLMSCMAQVFFTSPVLAFRAIQVAARIDTS